MNAIADKPAVSSPRAGSSGWWHRYVLYGVSLIVLASTVAVTEWQRRGHETITERVDHYHFPTVNSSIAIQGELYILERGLLAYTANSTSPERSILVQHPRVRTSLYVAATELRLISDMQAVYREPNFEELVSRLERQFQDIEAGFSGGLKQQNEIEALQRQLRAFALSLQQLQRLHTSEHAELTETLPGESRRRLLTLIAIIAGLIIVSLFTTNRVMKLMERATREGRESAERVRLLLKESMTYIEDLHREIQERQKAENALRDSEQRLQDIIDGIFVFVGVYTTDGVLVQANRAPLEAASLDPADVIGKPFWETYWWSYSEEVQDQLRDALSRAAKGETVRYDAPIRIGESEDGAPRLTMIDVTFGPLLDATGEVTQIVGSAVDISERIEAVARLRASEERYREFIEGTEDLVTQIDENGRFLYVNHATERVFGVPAAEIVGKLTYDFIYPEDRGRLRADFISWVKRKAELVTHENRQINVDGTTHTMLWTMNLHYNEYGRCTRVNSIGRDITRIRAAEERLQLQADIIDQVRDSVVSLDLGGIVTSWNNGAERMFGYTKAEAIGRHISFIYPPEKIGFLENEIIRPLMVKGTLEVDGNEVIRKSGESFLVHLAMSLLRDGAGTPIGMIGSSMDITERKEAERQIADSLAEKEVLLKEIHHRVKNNLQIISSLLNLQSAQIEDEEVQNLFAESKNRVSTMALIHEKLYRSDNLSEIDFGDYFRSLVDALSDSFGDQAGFCEC